MEMKAIILAGGFGSRLSSLTLKRAKPAVPFAGKYRIIDFTLSNCVNSDIFNVIVLTQYRPHSLNDHIGSGRPWDLDRTFTGGVQLLQPYKGRFDTDWYEGTADAVAQNLNFVRHNNPRHVLILSGDQVYRMDYRNMLAFHKANNAEVTVGAIRVPMADASRFGILDVDDDQRVRDFVEKPVNPPGNYANMGIYLFNYDVLERVLAIRHGTTDFGKDIFPKMVHEGGRVFAFHHDAYWVDVGTIPAYWRAHMDLVGSEPKFDLNHRNWIIRTRSVGCPSVRFGRHVAIRDSVISDGVVVADGGVVDRSVLSHRVMLGPGAVVRNSVILTDTIIEAGAILDHCVVDKQCSFGQDTKIGGSSSEHLTVIGKNTIIPKHYVVSPGCQLGTDLREEDFSDIGDCVIQVEDRLGFDRK